MSQLGINSLLFFQYNIQYLKSLQTNDYLSVVDCIKSSQQMRHYLKNHDAEWAEHLVEYLTVINAWQMPFLFTVLPPTAQKSSCSSNVIEICQISVPKLETQ